jgi:hypothetical protein
VLKLFKSLASTNFATRALGGKRRILQRGELIGKFNSGNENALSTASLFIAEAKSSNDLFKIHSPPRDKVEAHPLLPGTFFKKSL